MPSNGKARTSQRYSWRPALLLPASLRSTDHRFRPLIIGLVTALITLTCSVGVDSSPKFAAPGQNVVLIENPTSEAVPPTETATPEVVAVIEQPPSPVPPTPTVEVTFLPPIMYDTQAGDTLATVAIRFGVTPEEIREGSPGQLPEDKALLTPSQLLIIPARLVNTTLPDKLLPDSELVFSPSAANFDLATFIQEAGGYLANYEEYLRSTGTNTGAEIIYRVAIENSINPRLLLALLEYHSGWVYGYPSNLAQQEYPFGQIKLDERGLYSQLVWAVNHLSVGYYGWREGWLTDIRFSDGVTARLAPKLNAGTVALQYYFAKQYDTEGWVQALDPEQGFSALYARMFGDPWMRASTVEPLYPTELTQPELILPFVAGQMWSYTGGPHGAWEHEGARAALDFAPASVESGCVKSDAWAVAAAAGLVVRSGNGVVVLDLDGDQYEQTGWVLMYLHLSSVGRAPLGKWIETGDLLGHPSCEGGMSTGTHVHIARKYNGEWIPADGPVPFNLSGWIAHAGENPYEGTLTKEGETIYASLYGSFESRIRRYANTP